MNTNITQIKRALISISDKTGILELAKKLHGLGVEIVSTGGTAKQIAEADIPVVEISNFTGFPEMMGGRVKTLHPLVHAGILGLRDKHADEAYKHNVKWIDLVVCNLYPFAETISKPDVTLEQAIENIDIGGPSMIRSSAKNVGWVGVVVDPSDYTPLLEEIESHHGMTYETRKKLQAKAFKHTAEYDKIIANYFSNSTSQKAEESSNKFPNELNLSYTKAYDLRYGENPHQEAIVYKDPNNKEPNLLNAKIHQGKELSYNNLGDADAALSTLKEFEEPACVVVKHANPCGVAVGDEMLEVFNRAYGADALSAFGGIITLNRPCTKAIAEEIVKVFAEILIAPRYEEGALEILATKPKMRVLEFLPLVGGDDREGVENAKLTREIKSISGGLLVQDTDTQTISQDDLKFVTETKPTEEQIQTMLFAWKVLKHVKSNGILLAKNNTTVGIGMGQVSRVDAVKLAIQKAGDKINGSILASDAFFPFRDSIDEIAKVGVKVIIQPGGSIKDKDVIEACNEHGIAMAFTDKRCFKH